MQFLWLLLNLWYQIVKFLLKQDPRNTINGENTTTLYVCLFAFYNKKMYVDDPKH